MTIEAKLSDIYVAAHDRLPAQAAEFAHFAEVLGGAVGPAAAQANAAGAFDLASGITALGDELFFRFRELVKTLNDCATALDLLADDFATTDEAAVDWISKHQEWVDGHPRPGDRPDLPALPRMPGSGAL